MATELPEPDRLDGAPHPRETRALLGQAPAEAAFLEAFNTDRLHSGWLITGPRGTGKATLAYRIARFLLATEPRGGDGLFGPTPDATTLVIAEDHPDAMLVQSEAHPRLLIVRRSLNEKGDKLQSMITVDPVRKLKGFFQMSAADGGARVVIIDSADEMNTSAANALLKELEEPPANTTLLLISHQPSRLLPTIKSRCRELRCHTLSPDDLAHALTAMDITPTQPEALSILAQGSVGDAIRMTQSDGLALYADLTKLLSGLPTLNRQHALKLSEACAGRGAETRLSLTLDLIDLFLARAARSGIMGEPNMQAAPNEARLLATLSPHDQAARAWATLQSDTSARARHGQSVNLDPAMLVLDILLKIEDTARKITPISAALA